MGRYDPVRHEIRCRQAACVLARPKRPRSATRYPDRGLVIPFQASYFLAPARPIRCHFRSTDAAGRLLDWPVEQANDASFPAICPTATDVYLGAECNRLMSSCLDVVRPDDGRMQVIRRTRSLGEINAQKHKGELLI
jgi:hypothetical protein